MRVFSIDHVQLAMPAGGEEKARAFYGALLGLPEKAKPQALEARGGCWFERGDLKIHLGVETPFRAARKAHVALLCENIDGLAGRARAEGLEVVEDGHLTEVKRIFVFDPFGNRLELIDSRDENI
ncbi:MAG: VOC family protein [Caulobacteraceae bacterium]